MTGRQRLGIVLALAAACISGVSVWVNAMAVRAVGDPVLYTTIKNAIAAVLLVTLAVALTRRAPAHGLTRPRGTRQVVGLGIVGLFGGGLAFVLFFEGLSRTSAASAGFVQKTLVLWVAVLAVSFLRERFGALHVGAIALLLTGQLVIGGAALPALGTGESLVLLATLIWAVEVVIAKRLLADLSPLTVAVARMGIGGIALIGFAVASGHAGALATLSGTQWAWMALTGVILTGYVAVWLNALARAAATDVTAVLVVGAVITAVLNAGGQPAALAPAGLGLALILAGTLAIAARGLRSEGLVRQRQV
jgi:drug/metabolite transporter (DMT)-like permease